mmetsp:Transcript_25325/g.37512  ORF Transcript_25325/g.37512 Transcript_25325/m.37512 type:complete len:87 (+) Transcript_25325:311-571(+)
MRTPPAKQKKQKSIPFTLSKPYTELSSSTSCTYIQNLEELLNQHVPNEFPSLHFPKGVESNRGPEGGWSGWDQGRVSRDIGLHPED